MNWFSKKEEKKVIVKHETVDVAQLSDSDRIVMEIHDKIDSAEQRLLKETNDYRLIQPNSN